ncbi:MAG TPA: lamin tail domain-containing protein, partial [Candidatus Paceibacterota bacterium]|nr:lamin tail domain-containing protein [Candidatus Paceibacterota bacterium]
IIGIYTNQTSAPTSYPHKGREVPVRVEFFETNRAAAFAVNAGVRIGGENNWPFPEKPLNIHMRGKYGDDFMTHQIFPGEAVATFGKLNVRNGGDTWKTDMLRDAMMAPIMRGQTENDPVSYRPTVVFLNGRYWGIHDMRKMFDPVFFANEHQLPVDSYDYLLYAHDYSQSTDNISLMADAGTIDAYEAFHTFYTTHAMSQATNYAALKAQMNVDSFIDYVVINDFGVNTSWPWNREFWCAHAPGSKWQWNTPDLDRCFVAGNVTGSLIDDFRTSYPLFTALTNNPTFVNRLLQRYAAHLGSTLHSNRMNAILTTLAAEVDNEMPRHIARWAAEGGIPSLASRQSYLNEIKAFNVGRPAYAMSRLQTELGLNRGLANLAIACAPADGGGVRVAGVPWTPQYNTTIGLFKNTPVEITAEPAPGYAFVSWSNGDTNPTITLTLTADQPITANFQPGTETVLPASITADTTLTAANSPYTVTGDLIVRSNVTLTVGAGVKFLMPSAASIYVHGTLLVNGTSNAPVQMIARGGKPWGNLCFVNATGSSVLSHLTIRDAGTSRLDPVNLKGAVAGYNSTLMLDGADIEALLPVTARMGSTTVRNSRVHVLFTGDCINIKNGAGLVENCTLTGDEAPDVDGIDYDSVDGGVIRGNRIYAFNSINGDAIDLGYSDNVQVISNRIFNVYDKGISVGQGTVVHVQRNLIVNCGLGMGIKDAGSTAYLDQNTFARDTVGVAVYVKVVGRGGGTAYITNCIFSRCQDAPVTADALSFLSIGYSLSDTLALPGAGNVLADPLFTDAGNYDFSLTAGSPAINAGDPAHPLDADGTRADMGAYYAYDPADYPYLVPNLVVVNEVMAHSHDALPDWIELYNNSSKDVNLGGWWLSDNPAVPMKYRIANGTILPAHGYAVFYEDLNFAATNADPGALIPFRLSENGDTVNLFGPGDGLRPDYTEKEDFGASATGVGFGRYFRKSSRTYNFVFMAAPTPGAANSEPLVGPVVISEVMYHPPAADAEYIELANITTNPVTLFDSYTGTPWQMTKGVTHVFPASPALTLAPG